MWRYSLRPSTGKQAWGRGQTGQWVRVLCSHAKAAGSIPGQGTYRNQPMNASVSGTTNQSLSLALCVFLLFSLKSILKNETKQELKKMHSGCDRDGVP